MTPTLVPPELADVTVVHQTGSGRVVTQGGVYPLRGMNFLHARDGRGLVSLEAGRGSFDLSGAEADEVAPGHWRLRIDRAAILSVSPAQGDCLLVMRLSPPTYVSLDCSVRLQGDDWPTTVEWRGDGSASVRLR